MTMGAPEEIFEAERPRLIGLAYRLLGSVADAEDVVQDTWFRWAAADHDAIDRPVAWLTTVCSRVGLDRLRSRRRDRVDYVGPWLPDPIAVRPADDPAAMLDLSDSLTTSFLVMLERLGPEERLAVLLADVFGESFAAIADVTGRSEAACRQLASRGRKKLRSEIGGVRAGPADARDIASKLAVAVLAGDLDAVRALLAPEVVLVSDGGAHVHAARRPVVTVDRVARFLVNIAARTPFGRDLTLEEAIVNGAPGFIARRPDGVPVLTQSVDVEDGLVVRIHVHRNPEKLAMLDRSFELR